MGRREGAETYGAAARRIAGQADEPAAPRARHACEANGCPVPAPVTVEGRRLCCVHLAIRAGDARDWHEATRKVGRQPELLAVIRELRRDGHNPDTRAMVLQAMPQLYPIDHPPDREPSAFVLLRRAEAALVHVCTDPDAPQEIVARSLDLAPPAVETRDERRKRALGNMQWLADRYSSAVAYLRTHYRRLFGHEAEIVDRPRRDRQPGEDG